MDRNSCKARFHAIKRKVALRKESVDRNIASGFASLESPVALRKESVDRNRIPTEVQLRELGSLSARRAWIEIMSLRYLLNGH